MFKPEDFQLSVEKQLKLRVIKDEVTECRDGKICKKLMAVAEQLMKHQQLLDATLRQLLVMLS